ELLPLGCEDVATDQVLYNLTRRGIELDLVPWCLERRIPIMAYSPIEQGRLLDHPTVSVIANKHGATPAQVALAWALRQPNVAAIPKAGTCEHVRENCAALGIPLDVDDLAMLDEAFPPPTTKQPLEII
ncbi:MAG: oxidoreductase, partial [Labilithrix sp.]|nr:oxidoreductase [Labilithrix sp.]